MLTCERRSLRGSPLLYSSVKWWALAVTLATANSFWSLRRRGGKKGGKARAAKMTPEERSESARKAAKARWAKKRQQEENSS